MIVVGAAGTYWPLTVFPAGHPECVGVGGSTADDQRWQNSGQNYLGVTMIQISAPSEFVRQAAWNFDGDETASRDFGTSFGAAIVAGAAALWLERHGSDALALAGTFGEELMTRVMTNPLTTGAVDAVADAAETVAQGASDTLSKAAGWLGF